MRKITPDLGWPVYLMPIDEVAYYSATVGTNVQQKEFNACNRDVVARGRAPGIIPVEATQRPSADIIPTSLRDLFGYRWAFRCSTEASSDTILGHGWANAGYSATEIDPQARGVSWLRAEDGIPRRVKSAYLTDAADHRPRLLGGPGPRHPPRHPACQRPRQHRWQRGPAAPGR